jgi:hypothetical protein
VTEADQRAFTSYNWAHLWRCRALTLCKARLKKSTSIVLLARIRLEFENLLAQAHFPGKPRLRMRVQPSVTPVVKQVASYAQFSRKSGDAVVCVHAFDRLLLEFLAIPLTLSSLHFATPFLQSV